MKGSSGAAVSSCSEQERCVRVGAAPKGFYSCRIPKVCDSLLDAMRYVPGKVTDNLHFL